MTFQDFGLRPQIVQAVTNMGFTEPTPVQNESIPFLLANDRDLIGLAQTGTGKTAAFSLPIIHKTDASDKRVQTLMLCPTRELCLQIAKEIDEYAAELPGIKTVAVYGGSSMHKQKKALRKGAQIVVGTPGRTLDLIKRNILDVRSIRWLVLDEADEMLNMGFQKDLEAILESTPATKQTLLFSATMPGEMKGMVNKFMTQPHQIQVAKRNVGASNVEHHLYVCKNSDRYKVLQRLVDAHPEMYAIIFCRTRRETQEVADKLMQAGYNADTIHGDLNQNQRDNVMRNFKNKTIQLLVATDVASRGIDVDELTHVINYRLPDDHEVYVHRSGRTGRAGNSGISICIISKKEGGRIRQIEKMVDKQFLKQEIPSGNDICEQQILHFLEEIKEFQPDKNVLQEYWPVIEQTLGDMNSDEIINRLFTYQIQRFLETYDNAKDLNQSVSRGSKNGNRGKKKQSGSSDEMVGFTLNAGSKNSMKPKRLLALINEQTNSSDINVGDIIVKNKTTYFEVDEDEAHRIDQAFEGMVYHGKKALKRASRRPEPTQRSQRWGGRRKNRKGGKRKRR